MPWVNQPAKRLHDLVMLGSLPPRVRELYGLSWSSAQARAFPLAVAAAARPAGRSRRAAVRRGSCARSFALVEATERRRIERGKPTPQLPPLPGSSRGRAAGQASAAATSATAGIASEPSGAANGAVAVAEPLQQIRPLTLVQRRDDVRERRREVACGGDVVLDVVVAQRQRQLLDDRPRRSPRPRAARAARPGRRGRTCRDRRRSRSRRRARRRRACGAGSTANGTRSGVLQAASARRPPGRSTRRVSRSAASLSSASM